MSEEGSNGNDSEGNKENQDNNNTGFFMQVDWNEEQLKKLQEAGLEEIVKAKITEFQTKFADRFTELEKNFENQKIAQERSTLLLELANISRNPKLVEKFKDASIESINGAITAAQATRGPASFGAGTGEGEEKAGAPAYKDPASGIWYDINGNPTDFKG